MTRIIPAPFIPPALWKLIPSLAPTAYSALERPPHLLNIITDHPSPTGKYVAQRRRLIKTGTADLYYQIMQVQYADGLPPIVKAQAYYRGYPSQKPHWLHFRLATEQSYDFVSGRGKLLAGSVFTAERERALKLPGVVQMLEKLAPPEQAKNLAPSRKPEKLDSLEKKE